MKCFSLVVSAFITGLICVLSSCDDRPTKGEKALETQIKSDLKEIYIRFLQSFAEKGEDIDLVDWNSGDPLYIDSGTVVIVSRGSDFLFEYTKGKTVYLLDGQGDHSQEGIDDYQRVGHSVGNLLISEGKITYKVTKNHTETDNVSEKRRQNKGAR